MGEGTLTLQTTGVGRCYLGGERAKDILIGVVGPTTAFIISLGFRHPSTQMLIHSSVPHVVMFLSVSCSHALFSMPGTHSLGTYIPLGKAGNKN